jgi:hypothetical protein
MKYDLTPYVEKANKELSGKSLKDVQRETALIWCGRAVSTAMRIDYDPECFQDAVEYGHEAIEHAALSGDDEMLRFVRRHLDAFRLLD